MATRQAARSTWGGNINDLISARYRRAVQSHLILNFLQNTPVERPLILLIHGRPGEGKSWQLSHVLRDSGVEVRYINADKIESEHAGNPAKDIQLAYAAAQKRSCSDGGNPFQALVLDDVDALLGNWGPLVQTTVNRQLVIQELLKFADDPERVVNGSDDTNVRVPIFMTVNDGTKLYAPLLRSGRAQLFHWELSDSERARTLRHMFPNFSEDTARRLAEDHRNLVIADFAAILTTAFRRQIGIKLDKSGYASTFLDLTEGGLSAVPLLTEEEFVNYADEVVAERSALGNYSDHFG